MKTILHTKSGPLNSGWRSNLRFFALATAALLFSGATSWASDPVGAYALVDKVVLEPNETAPERIIVWGTFALAEGERGGKYKSPEKGYLYFKLPDQKAEVALKEWADLKSVAGKKEVIGFGTRYGAPAKVRPASEKPKDPDIHRTGVGLVRMNQRPPTYEPVKSLLNSGDNQVKKPS